MTHIDDNVKDVLRKPIQYWDLLSHVTSPPVPPLARHNRRRNDAPVWIDKVDCQEATVTRLGAVEEAKGIQARLEDLLCSKQARVEKLGRRRTLGKLIMRPSRIERVPSSCIAGARSLIP